MPAGRHPPCCPRNGHPRLEPEHLWNYQASLQARPWRTLSAHATAYYADLSNLIVTLGRFPNLQLMNSGRALNRGLEGLARWRARRGLEFTSGYAWLRSTNLAPLVPEHKWNYALEWDTGRAFLHLGVPFKRGWNAHVTVDNLFNRRYQVLAGYPMPGINALAGMSVRF